MIARYKSLDMMVHDRRNFEHEAMLNDLLTLAHNTISNNGTLQEEGLQIDKHLLVEQ
jgi:hypothetical protein